MFSTISVNGKRCNHDPFNGLLTHDTKYKLYPKKDLNLKTFDLKVRDSLNKSLKFQFKSHDFYLPQRKL